MTSPTPIPKIEYMFAASPLPAHPELVEGSVSSQSLADIVREETDHGRLIVRFLIDLMQGSLENSKPCHRLDAARELFNLGWAPAHAFIAAHSPPARRSREGGNLAPVAQLVLSLSKDTLHQDLAALICEETDNGRAAVRFLVDVMQANIHGFKPHHRLSAAKELLRRGFDTPAPEAEAKAEADVSPRRRDPHGIYYRDRHGNWQRDNARSPVPAPDDLICPEAEQPVTAFEHPVDSNRNEREYGPSCFDSYDEDDSRRDCYGDNALKHVLGSEKPVEAVALAVMDYRPRADRCPACSAPSNDSLNEWSAVPADAPLPGAIDGYPALLRIYGSEGAAGAAAHAAYRHHRFCQTVNTQAGNSSESEPPPLDRPVTQAPCPDWLDDPPPERPPPAGQGTGSARIILNGRGIDSVTVDHYHYGGNLCRSP